LQLLYSGPIQNILILIFGWICIGFVGLPIMLKKYFPSFDFESQSLDYRAIAEALRVQFYWRVCGIQYQVADYYLTDQRDELEWIRLVTRCGDLPPHQVASSDPNLQVISLIADHWISGEKGQKSYYSNTLGVIRNQLKRWKSITVIVVVLSMLTSFPSVIAHKLGVLGLTSWIRFCNGLCLLTLGTIEVIVRTQGLEEKKKNYGRMEITMTLSSEKLKKLLHLSCNKNSEEYPSKDLISAKQIIFHTGRLALEENGDWLMLMRERKVKAPVGPHYK
jgi:hypothetical protein